MDIRYISIATIALFSTPLFAQTFNENPDAALISWRHNCDQMVLNRTITTAVGLEHCDNEGMRRYLIALRFPWMDLEDTEALQHVANGERYDAHQISAQEWVAEDASIDSSFTTEMNRRVAIATQQAAAQNSLRDEQENNHLRAATQMLSPPPQPWPAWAPSPPAPPVNTECREYAGVVRCTTQ